MEDLASELTSKNDDTPRDFNVYAGAETGLLKGLNLNNKAVITKNFPVGKPLARDHEITCLRWANHDQTEILVGLRNQTIRLYDVSSKSFASTQDVRCGEGPLVGVARWNGLTVTAVKSGQVCVWGNEGTTEINALVKGEYLTSMVQNPTNPNIIATGGKENFLQVWDLNNPTVPVFKAKNVLPDKLQLRVPVWVTGISYVQDNGCLATCTRHKHVRLYDPRTQNRPVISVEWEESPLTCITTVGHDKSQVVVGTAHGRMGMFDMRMAKPEQRVVVMKGFAGAVRDIAVDRAQEVVVSVSLDRFLRVHLLKKKGMLYKEYLKSRLNCVLVSDHFTIAEEPKNCGPPEKKRKRR